MSSSLRPHGLEPTRLLCPWGFPGRNTGVDCYFLLREIFATGGQTHTSCVVWQVLYRWATREPPSLCQWSLRFSHFLRFTVSWTLVLSPCVLFTVLSWFFFGPQFRYEEASGYSGNESVFSVSLLSLITSFIFMTICHSGCLLVSVIRSLSVGWARWLCMD